MFSAVYGVLSCAHSQVKCPLLWSVSGMSAYVRLCLAATPISGCFLNSPLHFGVNMLHVGWHVVWNTYASSGCVNLVQ